MDMHRNRNRPSENNFADQAKIHASKSALVTYMVMAKYRKLMVRLHCASMEFMAKFMENYIDHGMDVWNAIAGDGHVVLECIGV